MEFKKEKIICDTREQKNQHILKYFEKKNIEYETKKVDEGDYKLEGKDTICIERKGNLNEIMANITQARFKRELERAKQKGVKLVVLIENSSDINSIDDIPLKWKNPRLEYWKFKARKQLSQDLGGWFAFCEEEINKNDEWELYRNLKGRNLKVNRPPQSPEQLRKALHTIEDNKEDYDVEFQFCSKSETGKRILELLSQQ